MIRTMPVLLLMTLPFISTVYMCDDLIHRVTVHMTCSSPPLEGRWTVCISLLLMPFWSFVWEEAVQWLFHCCCCSVLPTHCVLWKHYSFYLIPYWWPISTMEVCDADGIVWCCILLFWYDTILRYYSTVHLVPCVILRSWFSGALVLLYQFVHSATFYHWCYWKWYSHSFVSSDLIYPWSFCHHSGILLEPRWITLPVFSFFAGGTFLHLFVAVSMRTYWCAVIAMESCWDDLLLLFWYWLYSICSEISLMGIWYTIVDVVAVHYIRYPLFCCSVFDLEITGIHSMILHCCCWWWCSHLFPVVVITIHLGICSTFLLDTMQIWKAVICSIFLDGWYIQYYLCDWYVTTILITIPCDLQIAGGYTIRWWAPVMLSLFWVLHFTLPDTLALWWCGILMSLLFHCSSFGDIYSDDLWR